MKATNTRSAYDPIAKRTVLFINATPAMIEAFNPTPEELAQALCCGDGTVWFVRGETPRLRAELEQLMHTNTRTKGLVQVIDRPEDSPLLANEI